MNVTRGLIAGVVGGLAGSWAMNRFQEAMAATGDGRETGDAVPGAPREGRGPQPAQAETHPSDDATARAGRSVVEPVLGRPLARDERETVGSVMHFAFGASAGAAYGVAAELWPMTSAGAGVPFALAVWVAADEGVVPALGLSRGPRQLPASVLAYGAASHVVFGLTTDLVRRIVLRTLGAR